MENVPDRIEHTVLGPTTTWNSVAETLDEAIDCDMRACIPPFAVERGVKYAPSIDITTVIGFPHGQESITSKCALAEQAWRVGAAEIDVVANLGYLRGSEHDRTRRELAELAATVPIPIKVIVEAHLLSDAELHDLCSIASDVGVDYLKTATGFSNGGATVEAVETMCEYLPVKASGGIDSWEFASELFDAGASRIGSSSGDTIVRQWRAGTE